MSCKPAVSTRKSPLLRSSRSGVSKNLGVISYCDQIASLYRRFSGMISSCHAVSFVISDRNWSTDTSIVRSMFMLSYTQLPAYLARRVLSHTQHRQKDRRLPLGQFLSHECCACPLQAMFYAPFSLIMRLTSSRNTRYETADILSGRGALNSVQPSSSSLTSMISLSASTSSVISHEAPFLRVLTNS